MKAKEFQDKLKSGEIQVGAKGRLISKAIDSQVMQTNFSKPKEKIANRRRVDKNLQPISIKIDEWRKTHPDEIYFDSLIEGKFYYFLKEHNIPFEMKLVIEIQPKFEYLGEKIQAMTWKPDFAIRNKNQSIIIDTKGYPDASFRDKLKTIKHHFFTISNAKGLSNPPHIWFVNNKSKFIIALHSIQRVLNNQELDGIHNQLLFENIFNKKKKKDGR